MACAPVFPAVIPFDCVMEIIADIRSPGENWTALAIKGSWVLGCSISLLATNTPMPTPFGATSHEDINLLADDVELALNKHFNQAGPSQPTENHLPKAMAIDPALIMMIIELILKWLASRK